MDAPESGTEIPHGNCVESLSDAERTLRNAAHLQIILAIIWLAVPLVGYGTNRFFDAMRYGIRFGNDNFYHAVLCLGCALLCITAAYGLSRRRSRARQLALVLHAVTGVATLCMLIAQVWQFIFWHFIFHFDPP